MVMIAFSHTIDGSSVQSQDQIWIYHMSPGLQVVPVVFLSSPP